MQTSLALRIVLLIIMLVAVVFTYAQFFEIDTGIIDVFGGSTAWGDYDNDGDQDLLISGDPGNSNLVTKLYRNDGSGIFEDTNTGLAPVRESSADWGDYDNDGYLDILLTGYSYAVEGPITVVYRNNGNGGFSNINAGLVGVANSSGTWGDYDNDGDLDVLIAGTDDFSANYNQITKIYRNDGSNTFVDIAANLPGTSWSSVSWGDYDNDGDLDVLLTGAVDDALRLYISEIYRNDGNDLFTAINANLVGVFMGSADWGDYDNDGDLDIILSGMHFITASEYIAESRIYRNDGNNIFTDIAANLTPVYFGSAKWGDYDNDGDLDILLTGSQSDNITYYSKIYRNEGNDTFFDILAGLSGGMYSPASWIDFDVDGDLDILIAGYYRDSSLLHYPTTRMYINTTLNHNTVPQTPQNLIALDVDNCIIFQWDASFDIQTPSLGLTYALRIGSIPGGDDISTTMSNSLGVRKITERGPINSTCSWKIDSSDLPDYFYWTVQAIDGAYTGSQYAVEQTYNAHPEITVNSSETISFGDIPIDSPSEWVDLIMQNTGHSDLIIDSLYLFNPSSEFNFAYSNIGIPIAPGETDTVSVRFYPNNLGAISDTLFVVSNAANSPIVKIRLSGTCIHVPPQSPANVNITMDNNNAVVSWDAVTQTIFDTPITPEYYLVFHSTDPFGEFSFLGATDGLSYTQAMVGAFQPRMFYRVVAYKYYGRGAFDISSLRPGMPEHEVMGILASSKD